MLCGKGGADRSGVRNGQRSAFALGFLDLAGFTFDGRSDVSLVQETHLRRGVQPREFRGERRGDMLAGLGHDGGPEVAERRAPDCEERIFSAGAVLAVKE
jgi:hypothetical protein